METINSYGEQALKFLKETKTTFKISFLKNDKYFPGDKEYRDVYKVILRRNKKSYTFRFGQSLNDTYAGKEPTPYTVLACLTKYDPETFENFCGDFGYDTDSRTAEKDYKSVVREWKGVERLFSDVLDQLAEIQ